MSAGAYDEQKESIVFCEGYHDRDFWSGWLEHRGWTGPALDPATKGRAEFKDPWDKAVKGKSGFGFVRDRRFVRVRECGTNANVIPDALNEIRKRPRDELRHVVVNLDSDATDGGEGPAEARLKHLAQRLSEINGGTAPVPGPFPGSYKLRDKLGEVLVSGVVWRVEAEAPGVPAKQTLERLVAAALAAAYPDKAAGVDLWLKAAPSAAVDGKGVILGKAYTWSYMAKWYSEHGRDGFYRLIWDDPKVCEQLESRLKAIDAWQVAEAL